jgi:hypothetical protein
MSCSLKLVSGILLFLTLVFSTRVNSQTYLPKSWEKCAVMIEKEWQDKNGIVDTIPHGTGFVFKDDDLGFFLVTNRHVLKDRSIIFIRYNKVDCNPKRDLVCFHRESYPLIGKDSQPLWKGHPDSSVDVAALRIWLPTDALVAVAHVDYSRFKFLDSLEVGEDVYFFGFPLGIIGWKGMGDFPVLRSGIVSYKSLELIRIGDTVIDSAEFLIDGFSFAGNSGSPVFTRATPWAKAALVGIIKSHVPKFEQEVVGADTITLEQNTGLAIAECANRIKETLEQFRAKGIPEKK